MTWRQRSEPADGRTARSPGNQVGLIVVGTYVIVIVLAIIGIVVGAPPVLVGIFGGVAVCLFVLVPQLRAYRRRIKKSTGSDRPPGPALPS